MAVQQTVTAEEGMRYAFGQNWNDFVQKHFSQERVAIARKHILEFLDVPDLRGKYFLDIGCGSGLHSMAALQAGAARIVSFDYDIHSVKTTLQVREFCGNPANWSVMQGSVLDRPFLATLEPADVVYSWGVLHHTGSMWAAVENAASLVRPGGLFYIALYLKTAMSPYWIDLKRRYNRASDRRKRLMEARYILRHEVFPRLVRGRNPIAYIRNYQQNRGMDFLVDVRDWLGGYPYEDATLEEVVRFCYKQLRLHLVNLAPGSGLAEYLFRPGAV